MKVGWCVGVAALCLVASVPAQAGFFDEIGAALFGSRRPEPRPLYEADSPLDITVRPRSRRVPSRPLSDNGKIVNTSIDPVKHPTWFLEDATLRKGDVVVLNGQVLVFNGGRVPYTRGDFSALGESRLLSKSLRDRVRAMAGLPPPDLAARSSRADAANGQTVAVLRD